MHVDHLPISFLPAHDGCDEDECVFCYEIPYTSFVSGGVARVRLEVEFEGGGKGEEDGEGEEKGEHGAQSSHFGELATKLFFFRRAHEEFT